MSRDILLNEIDPDRGQPRQHFDDDKLAELARTMGAKGLIVPILVRPNGDGRFTIVHGERRYRAAQSLGWETIRAEVRDVDADEAHWLALIENVQRQDLSPIEEARAYQGRLEQRITQAELGERIGKSQSYIAQKLRLLKLPDDVQGAIAGGDITEGHARQLLKLKDADWQSELCQRVTAERWTVAKTQEVVDMYGCPYHLSMLKAIIKTLYLDCPGIKLTPVGLEFPEDVTFEQWNRVGQSLRVLAGLVDG